jgi:hypothetical protein
LGDIYEEKTLTQVDKNLKNRGIPAIDLAVGAPYCGWGNWQRRYPLNVYLDTYYPMLQWTYDRLNPNGGMLLTELMPGRTRLTGNEAYAWESRMNDAGIVTNVAPGKRNFVAKIERQPTSPANIVPLQGRCVFRR